MFRKPLLGQVFNLRGIGFPKEGRWSYGSPGGWATYPLPLRAEANLSFGPPGGELLAGLSVLSPLHPSLRPTRISQPEDSRQPSNVIRQPLGPDGSQGFKQRR